MLIKSLLKTYCSYPLSAAGEERVVEQSDDRVSPLHGHNRLCITAKFALRLLTLPYVRDCAARPSPLRGKEGKRLIYNLRTTRHVKSVCPGKGMLVMPRHPRFLYLRIHRGLKQGAAHAAITQTAHYTKR